MPIFNNKQGKLIKITGNLCKPNLFIIDPSYFADTLTGLYVFEIYNLIDISSMIVYMHGPVVLSMNHANSIMFFKSCDVIFSKEIIFKLNECDQLINLQFPCIKIMEYSNITLIRNKYHNKIIEAENDNEYNLYPLCIFQFVTLRNITVPLTHYSVNIVDNIYTYNKYKFILNQHQEQICSYPFYHFTPHCQWISDAVFHSYNPGGIYQQILKTDNENHTYHRISHCFQIEAIVVLMYLDQYILDKHCKFSFARHVIIKILCYMQRSTVFFFLIQHVMLPLKMKR